MVGTLVTHRLSPDSLVAINSFVESANLGGEDVVRIVKDPRVREVDEPTYGLVLGSRFRNGTIKVKVFSRLLPDAPDYARGFIGVAFRINEDNSEFESFYVRPTNGSCEDQLRRNRATQYFAYPNYKFDRLREESPGMYESYVDIRTGEWIDLEIVVKGQNARLYVNESRQPVLIVNDLKHGPDRCGAVALWVDIGTEGFFKDLVLLSPDIPMRRRSNDCG